MPININYNAPAADIAGLALLGGQGQYAQNVNQLLTSQWQTAAQLNNARLMAMQQAAAQAQQQASQQNFEMQMAPMKSFLDMQNQAFQSNLGSQADAQRQNLGAQIHAQQSQQDFGEQQQISAQQAQQQADNEAARIAQQQQGQLDNQQQMKLFTQDQQIAQQFQTDPYATFRKNQQQAQQSGYTFSDDQNSQIADAQKTITAAQKDISMGRSTLPTLLPAIKQAMTTLGSVSSSPAVPPPPTMSQQVSKLTSWFNPNPEDPSQAISDTYTPGSIPVTIDQKTGKPMIWQGYKAPEAGEVGEDGQIVTEKVAGQRIANQSKQAKNNMAAYDWASDKVQKEMQTPAGMMASAQDPQYGQRRLQELIGIYQQMNQGIVKPVSADPNSPPQGGPPPAGIPGPQVTPQNPQGTPDQPMATNQPVGGPTMPQQPNPAMNQHPSQIPPQQQAMQVVNRLKATPRDRWSPHDWMLWAEALKVLQQQPQGNTVAQAG